MSFCGLECDSCPILLATKESDHSLKTEMRQAIAQQLSEIYKTIPKPEIITDCDGCKTPGGRLFTGCIDCVIRRCAMGKELPDCAHCENYPCENLLRHFVYDPASHKKLDDIRQADITEIAIECVVGNFIQPQQPADPKRGDIGFI